MTTRTETRQVHIVHLFWADGPLSAKLPLALGTLPNTVGF